jgi:cysteine desulfurase
MDTIYLDHNATTPIDARVVQAMRECYARFQANPASQHRPGQAARHQLERAREQIAAALEVDITRPGGDRLVFTSGGTEANNWAIRGLARTRSRRIVVSEVEHPSVLDVSRELSRIGFSVDLVPVQSSGRIDLDRLSELIAQVGSDSVQLVSTMLANNETGVIQPISEIVNICRSHNIPVHVDAVQAVGKIPVAFQQLGITVMSISAHKFHGPVGIGAIAIQRGSQLEPWLFGGHQQLGLRPGTESVALAVGMAKALEVTLADLSAQARRMSDLRDRFEAILLAAELGICVNGAEPRLCQTSNLSFPGIDRQALCMALDYAGIACSTGSACSSGSSERSHVLVAMGLPEPVISSAIRFSLGAATTMSEVEEAAARIIACVRRLNERHR